MHRIIIGALVAGALLCLVVIAGIVLAGKARAESQCGPHGDLVKILALKYQESRRHIGTITDRAVMEIFVSAKRSWTILATDTLGLSCIIAAGQNFEDDAAAALKGPPL